MEKMEIFRISYLYILMKVNPAAFAAQKLLLKKLAVVIQDTVQNARNKL
jgi:hypothetical protein